MAVSTGTPKSLEQVEHGGHHQEAAADAKHAVDKANAQAGHKQPNDKGRVHLAPP
jgi:hypothetical protein